MFERKGLITLEATAQNKSSTVDDLLDISLDHGVEDVRETDVPDGELATFQLIMSLNDLSAVTSLFSTPPISDDWVIQSSEMSYEPVTPVTVVENPDDEGISEEKAESLDKLVGALEMEPDVTQVWTNLSG